MKILLLSAFLAPSLLFAQTGVSSYQSNPNAPITIVQTLPSSSTPVCGGNTKVPCGTSVVLHSIHLANHSASSVSVTLTDNSTNCNGSQCQPWPTVTIAANTVYTTTLPNIPCPNGFNWYASASASVDAYVQVTY